ncbi:hypothetical protein EB796_003874 [Bugula neritina]|uniref:Uncharacterized protein n=1 Tax=Bugula neritina TaxID=10212 RepID=A0A7J7KIU7_BUGNE|nr:hypothetical protein EB796_003874 [Bugula neritina]
MIEVTSDSDLHLIQTPGVQIFGLQTTTAPRRKDPKSPILETYEFVANDRITAVKPNLQDYANFCSSAACSSLKCIEENTKDPCIPNSFITQLSQMYKSNQNVNNMLSVFLADKKLSLPTYKNNLSLQVDDRSSLIDVKEDVLLISTLDAKTLKPALDIVFENIHFHKLKITEIGCENRKPCYGKVLDVYDNTPLVKVDYTLWTHSNSTTCEDSRVAVVEAGIDVNHIPVTEQNLIIFSICMRLKTASTL